MSRCRASSNSFCAANSHCTILWMWNRDRPSPNQRPSASPRPRSYSHTPDVRIPSPACSRRQQLRPVQPFERYLTSPWYQEPRLNPLTRTQIQRPNHNSQSSVLSNTISTTRGVIRNCTWSSKFDMWESFRAESSLFRMERLKSIIIFITKRPLRLPGLTP